MEGRKDAPGGEGDRAPVSGCDGPGTVGVGSPVSASWRAPLNTFSLCSLTQPRVLRRLERKLTAAAISGSMFVLFPVQLVWLIPCAAPGTAAGSCERSLEVVPLLIARLLSRRRGSTATAPGKRLL